MAPFIRLSIARCRITRLRSKPYSMVDFKAKILLRPSQAVSDSHKTASNLGNTTIMPVGSRPHSEVWRQLTSARLAGAKNEPSVEGKRDIQSMLTSKYPAKAKLDVLLPFRKHARAALIAATTPPKVIADVPAGLDDHTKDSKNAPSLETPTTAKKAPLPRRRRAWVHYADKNPKTAALWNSYANKQIKEYEYAKRDANKKLKSATQPTADKNAAAAKEVTEDNKIVSSGTQTTKDTHKVVPNRRVHYAARSLKHLVNKKGSTNRKAIKKFASELAHVKAASIAARKEDKSIRLAVEIVRGRKWSCIIRHRVSGKVTAICVVPIPRKVGSKIRGARFIRIPSGEPSHPFAREVRKGAASDDAPRTLQDEQWAREQSTKIVRAMFPKAILYKSFPQQGRSTTVKPGHKSAEQVFTIVSGGRKGRKASKRKVQTEGAAQTKA